MLLGVQTINPRLGVVPPIRIAKRKEVEEKLDELAQFVGEEEFYLKVGGDLIKRSSEVGLVADGRIVPNGLSRKEHIEAKRVIEEDIKLESYHSKTTFNTSLITALGELKAGIDEFKEVRAQFMTQRVAEGATMEVAKREDKALQELLETKEVKESYSKLKENNKKLQVAAEKIETIDQKARETKSESTLLTTLNQMHRALMISDS
jgi:hypothetical protein